MNEHGASSIPRLLDVWLITIGEPLSINEPSRRLRTGVFADFLVEMGHRVTWFTSRFNHYAKKYFTEREHLDYAGIKYQFLNGRPYHSNISLARLANHREIAKDFRMRAPSMRTPDIIVCSFPPIELADEASRFANERDIPVIVDIRDLWPDELSRRLPSLARPLAKPLIQAMESRVRRTMRRADAIVGVSRAYLDWGLEHASRTAGTFDHVIPLGYADTAAAQTQRALRKQGVHRNRGLELFFAGAMNNSVDLDVVIGAFRQAPNADLSATFAGAGDKLEEWQEAGRQDHRLRFAGWVDPSALASLAQTADVGLVTYRPESLVAMPNKIFEYLSFGFPIVNSIPGEAARLVEQHEIGLNYIAGDVQSFRACVEELAADPARRTVMARNSAQLFEREFRADRVYARYFELLQALCSAKVR